MHSLALATILALSHHSSPSIKLVGYNNCITKQITNYEDKSALFQKEELNADTACATSSNPEQCRMAAHFKNQSEMTAVGQQDQAGNAQCMKLLPSSNGPYYHLVQHLLPRAQQGNVDAQLQLASVYKIGKGVPQDYGKALYWYRQAAAQGNAKAEDSVGRFYQYRWGVPQNYPRAVEWYSLAAKQGFPRGEVDLAWMYLHGLGTAPNYKLAYLLTSDAYKHHNAKAADYIGNMYFSGEWVPRNITLARRYWKIAFNWGYSDALVQLNMTRPLPAAPAPRAITRRFTGPPMWLWCHRKNDLIDSGVC